MRNGEFNLPLLVEVYDHECKRSEAQLRESLHEAGFTIEAMYGGWHRGPIGHPDGEHLVAARTIAR
jgi:hypothetical protein